MYFLGIAPQGVMDVHEMLFKIAYYLTSGVETGIFTPVHLMICQNPLQHHQESTKNVE